MKITKNGFGNVLFFACLAAAVFLCSFTGSLYLLRQDAPASPAQYASRTAAQDTYTVRVYNGSLGVFVNGSDTPQTVLDVDVSLLRKDDLALFEKGVTLHSRQELAQLMEDFSN